MYQRILLAYDGTEKGRGALREGALMAQRMRAQVFLLAVVVEDPGNRLGESAGGASAAQLPQSYREVLEEGVRRLRRLGFEPQSRLVIGEPAQEIGHFAEEIHADLVVVGHHRQGALGRWWSGPRGAYLIEHIPCSMLVSQNVVSDAALAEARELADSRGSAAPATETPVRQAAEQQTAPAHEVRIRRPSRRGVRIALLMLVPVAVIIALLWYVFGGASVSVTDAYVEADKVGVSTDVAGFVQQVAVTENQHVTPGQLLFRLDDQPYRIALDRAEAQVGIARNSLQALQSNYKDAQAQLRQAQYDTDYYMTEFKRARVLHEAHVTSQTALDTARRSLENSRARLISLQQQLGAVRANLNGDPESPVEDNPRYRDAVAQRDEAARQLRDTVVRAPFAGMVTNVPAIAPGRYLAVQATAFYLVATDHVWVDANPKETELTWIRVGQPATVRVDTYPDVNWHARVESIAPAAAQEFSLLPAQNTSGNWVKVVQRIPMRLRVETDGTAHPPLRAGMSVEVSVNTGHRRGWPRFLGGGAHDSTVASR